MMFERSLCLDEQQRESIVEIKAAVKATDYWRAGYLASSSFYSSTQFSFVLQIAPSLNPILHDFLCAFLCFGNKKSSLVLADQSEWGPTHQHPRIPSTVCCPTILFLACKISQLLIHSVHALLQFLRSITKPLVAPWGIYPARSSQTFCEPSRVHLTQ